MHLLSYSRTYLSLSSPVVCQKDEGSQEAGQEASSGGAPQTEVPEPGAAPTIPRTPAPGLGRAGCGGGGGGQVHSRDHHAWTSAHQHLVCWEHTTHYTQHTTHV